MFLFKIFSTSPPILTAPSRKISLLDNWCCHPHQAIKDATRKNHWRKQYWEVHNIIHCSVKYYLSEWIDTNWLASTFITRLNSEDLSRSKKQLFDLIPPIELVETFKIEPHNAALICNLYWEFPWFTAFNGPYMYGPTIQYGQPGLISAWALSRDWYRRPKVFV